MELHKVPKLFKNFYFLFSVGFVIWMLFLDANNLGSQIKRSYKLDALEKEKSFYEEKIVEVEKDREELMTNDELLEKFARENYLMKKPHEDVYVIVRR